MAKSLSQFDSTKGCLTQQRRQGQIPVCVVTTAKHSEILLSNDGGSSTNPRWVIAGATVYQQRFWTTSSARINLTINHHRFEDGWPALPQYGTRNRPLQCEDLICVYIGYLDRIRPITDLDIKQHRLLRVFVGVIDTITPVGTPQGTRLTLDCRDRMRYLMDTVVTFAPGETLGNLKATFGGSEKIPRSQIMITAARAGVGQVTTPPNVKEYTGAQCNIHGFKIDTGYIQDLQSFKDAPAGKTFESAHFFYQCPNPLSGGNVPPLAARTENTLLDVRDFPQMHIMVGRLGFETEKAIANFSIENQIPAELMKFWANQEPYPVELFSSHMDGDYYYAPRRSDASGLQDPKRFYRTYYYHGLPSWVGDKSKLSAYKPAAAPAPAAPAKAQGITYKPPGAGCILYQEVAAETVFATADPNQRCINFREEQSTVALKTNYIVANSSPSESSSNKDVLVHLTARPYFLRGEPIGGRNFYVVDNTANNPTEAVAVAAALARNYAKELRAASATVIGDPTLCSGEVIQLIGSPLHPRSRNLDTVIKERKAVLEYLTHDDRSYFEVLEAIRKATESENYNIKGSLNNEKYVDDGVDPVKPEQEFKTKKVDRDKLKTSLDVLCAVTKPESGTVVQGSGQGTADWADTDEGRIWRRSGFNDEPRTFWRIEGVRHSFSSGGQNTFTTEIALLSIFG